MQILVYYHPLCPFSKQIITLLGELGLKYSLIRENYWKKSVTFMDLSPWGELPVMVLNDSTIITGVYPCIEYLIDTNRDFHLFHKDLALLTCVRQIINWFNKHFYNDTVAHVINEKFIKPMLKNQYPDTNSLRIAKNNLTAHMLQLNAIISAQEYVAYESLSLADIVAASHLAVLDYFQDINWQNYPKIKQWYCLIKSRPSFRSTLYEKINGITPPAHYLDLDF